MANEKPQQNPVEQIKHNLRRSLARSENTLARQEKLVAETKLEIDALKRAIESL